jgi:hypothetical protein
LYILVSVIDCFHFTQGKQFVHVGVVSDNSETYEIPDLEEQEESYEIPGQQAGK